MVGMTDQASKLPASTSGGQQQRTAIARSLANDPPIVVADEPTGNLDAVTAEEVFELFQRLVQGGRTIVMVTHDPDLAVRTGRTVHMVDGRIMDGILDGAPAEAPASI
jgi:putative ABC transport system ATP-binding protein